MMPCGTLPLLLIPHWEGANHGESLMNDSRLLIHLAEEGGYRAEFPDRDGCFLQGEAIEELVADAPEAISSHIAVLYEEGQTVPEPQAVMVMTVRVPATPAA